jgi:hypothetical protein
VISDDVREQAALICAIAASTPRLCCDYASTSDQLDPPAGDVAFSLAMFAWHTAFDRNPDLSPEETDAEAEALIRTGWTP